MLTFEQLSPYIILVLKCGVKLIEKNREFVSNENQSDVTDLIEVVSLTGAKHQRYSSHTHSGFL
jgi:predicted house-cleaning noncanonical NTP pyrophosphatase (MazG superfamily)